MTSQSDRLTETPRTSVQHLLQDVLASIRLSGSLIVRAELTAPWAYDSPAEAQLHEMLHVGARRLLLFHMIPQGRCWVALDDGTRVELEGGDVVVLPYADHHRVGSPESASVVPIHEIMPPQPWDGLPVIRHGGGGELTGIVCGYFTCDELLFNPVFRALPRVFRVRPPEGPSADWMKASMTYALTGAAPCAATRLFEVIFVEMMRLHVEAMPPGQSGWLAALRDPVLGRALACLHADPAQPWTVESLARRAATSRTVLAERFRELLGRSPMRYLAEWRLQLAADMLRGSNLSVGEVAGRVGYEAEAAFNRAFRRHLGEPPARWREQARVAVA
jgi:AraC-like DNA-binding protein